VSESGDRRIGAVFGLLGAGLLAAEAILDVAYGVFDLAARHGGVGSFPFGEALVLIVVALIVGFFSILGGLRPGGNAVLSGVVLVVLAIVGWLVLGLGGGLLGILGAVLMLVAGIVFLASGR
jgi:hypothetical protein